MTVTGNAFRVVVLISGSGSNLQALLDNRDGYDVSAVIADRSDAYGIQRSLAANVPTLCLPLLKPRDQVARRAWEALVADTIGLFEPDLVVMCGWMRIMSPSFVARFADRIINQHPALLPDDAASTVRTTTGTVIPALRGAHVVRDALRLHLPLSGCTIHRVTAAVDVGPVLDQAVVPIFPSDDEQSLHERIKQVERRLIVAVVRRLAHAANGPAT